MWGSQYNIARAIFDLLKGDYRHAVFLWVPWRNPYYLWLVLIEACLSGCLVEGSSCFVVKVNLGCCVVGQNLLTHSPLHLTPV